MQKAGSRKNSPFHRILLYGLEYLGRYYSSYPGYVINVNDPENRNRVQVASPEVDGRHIDNYTWAECKGQWGGKDYGLNMVPVVGDLVWLSYRHGDSKFPLWQPAGYAEKQKPEEFTNNRVYGFKTPKGHLITIDDDNDLITIKHNKDGYIKMSDGQIIINDKELIIGEGAEQPALLGNDTEDLIKSIIDQIKLITVPTPSGVSGPPANAAAFTAIKNSINIKSTKMKIE